MRTFFALVPQEDILNHITQVVASFKEGMQNPSGTIRWVCIENLHITLGFLEHIDPNDIKPLTEGVRASLKNAPSFSVELGPLRGFPSEENPIILSLFVKPNEALDVLSTQIGRVIKALNYPIETRPFRPHMTLGRIKNAKSLSHEIANFTCKPIPTMEVNALYLIESKPGIRGSHYYPLSKFELGINPKN